MKILEVQLGAPVGSLKGSVWPASGRSGKPLSMHSVDGPAELTVRFPSGRVWSAKPVHSVIYTANEATETIRSVDVVYERAPLSWPDAVARVLELATELGVTPENQELWAGKLAAMAKGTGNLYPSFPLEGCIVLTTAIRSKSTGWIVTPEIGSVTPETWKVYGTWPDSCH